MKQWHHKHSNNCLCDTSHLCTSQSAIQSLGISFVVDLNNLHIHAPFLTMTELKQVWFCSFGLTKTFLFHPISKQQSCW